MTTGLRMVELTSMAVLPNIRRNLEAGGIYIPLWINGLHVNRSPLFTPISALGVQIISRFDTLWGGSNMEISMQNTLTRRPGYPQWCSSAFGVSEWPQQFYSYQNLAGSITTLVDTQTNIYSFTPSSKTSLLSKTSGATQTAFQRIGQALYMANYKGFQATGDQGTVSAATVRPVGIAVPTVTPLFTLGTTGFLLPTTGFTYGYSYANSISAHVSTMSPISANVGDLNVQEVTEASVTYPIATWSASGGATGPPMTAGTVVFGTPNGNNLWVGAVVNIQGFGLAGTNKVNINGKYTVTAVTSSSFSASTAQWGTATGSSSVWNEASTFGSSNVTGVTAVLNPITIPGSGAANPAVYTVAQAANFAPTNAYGAATPSPISVTGPAGSPVYTQLSSGTPSTHQYVVNASTGAITFATGDEGNTIIVKYAITPVTGGSPVSFVLTGPSTNNSFAGNTQTDTTGYANADSVVVYRDQDSDGVNGPWYYLALIPNNLALSSATYYAGTNNTVYTLANPCLAAPNNGFAGAANTKGAIIAGFTNAANNGTFDIVASTSTTITCLNASGVTETHAATVNSGSWTYTDTGAVFGYAFDLTVPDGELDFLIEAPIDDENNPPPNVTNPVTTSVDGTFSLLCYGAGRMWGAVDNYVCFAGGPDVTYGNGNESWPPANVFTFPGKVTALASVPAGIIVFTADDFYIIYGTSTSTFYPQVYQKNFGVASQNCLVMDGDTLYIYSNTGQLWSFTNSLNEIGINVAPLLSLTFTPPSVYLTMHKMGEDVGLFISDGTTNYLRYRIDQGSWSPLCQIVNGANCFQSIETSLGVYTLLVGSASGSGYIAGRSLTSWTDIGGTYACNGIVGSLVVAPPGSTALVDFLTLQYVPTGTAPTVSILPQDIATLAGVGNFVSLGAGVNDPPKLLATGSSNMTQQRWYLKSASTPIAQEMCNLQVKISFPAENYKAEIMTLGVT